jgi:phosphoglycolate phosphatase-like HAD superfamily hydrolase
MHMLQADVKRHQVQVDHVVGREEDSFCKRQRAVRLLERLRVPPTKVVVIGDGLADEQLSKCLGARCIGVSWGMTHPTRLRELGVPVIASSSQIIVD